MRNHELMWLGLEDWRPLKPLFEEELVKSVEMDLSSVQRLLTKLDIFSILENFHNWIVDFQRLEQ
jgi:hypothetical protein